MRVIVRVIVRVVVLRVIEVRVIVRVRVAWAKCHIGGACCCSACNSHP